MPSSHVAAFFHLVFSTKNRQKIILPDWEPRLHSYLGGIIKGMDAFPIEINGTDDHQHILARLKSKHRLDNFLQELKGRSSLWIHQEITRRFEWQKGYGAFSVSPDAVEGVRRYIRNQKEHHKRVDFKTEYVDLLNKAGIEFEEEYLW